MMFRPTRRSGGPKGRLILVGLILLVLGASVRPPALARGTWDPIEPAAHLPADQIIRGALIDSLYYNFKPWFEVFREKIRKLEAASPSLRHRLDLMKFHFYFAGLLGEFSHTLAFTSKYKIQKVADEFFQHSTRAKELAQEVLDRKDLNTRQKAEAYLFLGAAEGYIGIFEYGEGHLLSALINGFQADNHLEEALDLDPSKIDAHFGLGIYRYGNSRLGGLGNLIMQGGRDLREVGLNHIEHAIQEGAPSTPLAMKTLAWFYIAEQINPDNEELSRNHPLSPEYARVRAHTLMDQFEKKFLRDLPGDLPGNKELEMMKAIQFVLDGHFRRAQKSFQKILDICDYLIQVKGMPLNPQLVDSVKEGIKFCDLMLLQPDPAREQEVRAACRKIHSQLEFLQSGGSMVEYDAKKIRSELHAVFAGALTGLSKKMDC